MSELSQIGAVTLMNLRTIPQRVGSSLVIVVGMASVVAVMTAVLAMSTGILQSIGAVGRADSAIVLASGAQFQGASSLPRDNLAAVADAPGVAKGPDGKPIASQEFFAGIQVVKRSNGHTAFVTLAGVGPEGFQEMPEIKLVAGRMFRPAVHELIVGQALQSQFTGLDIGDEVSLPSGDWKIVGAYTAGGNFRESELVGDIDTLMSAYRRNTFNDVSVQLVSPAAFNQFKDALTTNPTLKVDVVRESDYFAKEAKPLSDLVTTVAYVVGGIMAIGAVFGALNTMYSAVSARTREIATLRAIGFGAGAVVISVLAEATLLSLVGAVLGALIAWVVFNGAVTVTDGVVFAMAVTAPLVGVGLAWGAVVGVLGGLFPAIRAARLPVAAALRAT